MTIVDRLTQQAPGVMAIASAPIGRYRVFDRCVDRVHAPIGTIKEWEIGLSTAANYNKAVRTTLKHDRGWLWLMDDDHVFPPDILLNLLERDVDIVTPLYLRRVPPFVPVVHSDAARGYLRYDFSYIEGKTGLLDVTEEATLPTGGMLIRRAVLEAMKDPWFEQGQIDPEYGSWDLHFCEKARHAGFKLHLDTDNRLGHIIHVAVWPDRDENNVYSPDIRMPG